MASKRQGRTRQLKSTAYHEAGHVVAAFALGLHVESVSIVHGPESLGHVRSPSVLGYHSSGFREQQQIARSDIIGYYAGMEAERLFDPEAPDSSGYDEQQAFWLSRVYEVFPRYFQGIGDPAHTNYLERLRLQTRRLLKKNWAAVETVAKALLNKKTLNTHDLEVLRGRLFPKVP